MKKVRLFLVIVIIFALGFNCKGSLEEERINKINQIVHALKDEDSASLQSLLRSDDQEITKKEVKELLKKINELWGDLKQLEPIYESSLATPLDKGNMQVIAEWGKTPTHEGTWLTFRSDQHKNYYLRVGLLFKKRQFEPR